MVIKYCVNSVTDEFGELVKGSESDPRYVLYSDYEQLGLELARWNESLTEANENIDRLETENKKLRADMVRIKTMLEAVRGEVEQLQYEKEQGEQATTN